MQIHSLGLEDFYEDNYTLIGIHTALEDFKLAYLLNNNLNTHFLERMFYNRMLLKPVYYNFKAVTLYSTAFPSIKKWYMAQVNWI